MSLGSPHVQAASLVTSPDAEDGGGVEKGGGEPARVGGVGWSQKRVRIRSGQNLFIAVQNLDRAGQNRVRVTESGQILK